MRYSFLLLLIGTVCTFCSVPRAAETNPCDVWGLQGYVLGMTRDEALAVRPATPKENGILDVKLAPTPFRSMYLHLTAEGRVDRVVMSSTALNKDLIRDLSDGLHDRLGKPWLADQPAQLGWVPMRQTTWLNQECDTAVWMMVERGMSGALYGRMVQIGLAPASVGSKVTEDAKRIFLPGYSIGPPRGEGWRQAPKGTEGGDVIFGKPPTTPFHTIVAKVESGFAPRTREDPWKVGSDETLKVLAGAALQGAGKSGPKGVSSRIEPAELGGASCLRYDHTIPHAPTDTPKAPDLELSVHGIVCRHPDFPRLYVSASWSERRPTSEAPAGIDAEGEAFLAGFALEPVGLDVATVDLYGSAWGVAGAAGSVWVAHEKGRLARIDPATGAVRAEVEVGDVPVGVAASEDAVWVATRDDNKIVRVDPKTNKVVARVKTGKRPLDLAVGEGSVWAADYEANNVTRIDAVTNEVLAKVDVGQHPVGIASCPQGIFVANFDSGTVSRIDPRTNKTVAAVAVGKNPYGLTCDSGSVWVTLNGEGMVVRFDAESGETTGRFAVGDHPTGVVSYRGAIWIEGRHDSSLTVLDPVTGEPGTNPLPAGSGPVALAVVGGDLWLADAASGAALRFRPK